ncbi:MAG: hypothetical protein U0441_04325 [Polyangiaceae bacterium]
MTSLGTYNEIGLVVLLSILIVVATKIGAIGQAIGGYFDKKP